MARGRRASRPWILRGAQLVLLLALAVMAPLVERAAAFPDYFADYRCDGWDLLVLAVLVFLGPPAIVTGLTAFLGPRLGRLLHGAVAFSLLTLLLLQCVCWRLQVPFDGALVPCLILAVVFARRLAPYPRNRRQALLLVGLASVVPLRFLLSPGLAPLFGEAPRVRAVAVAPRTPRPVIFLVFDELALVSMMTPDGRIDGELFPNFAALARDGIWFRNATTVFAYTKMAIPSLLTGRRPTANLLPVAAAYPENLFRLLGGGYRMRVFETGTRLLTQEAPSADLFAHSRLARVSCVTMDAVNAAAALLAVEAVEARFAEAAQHLHLIQGGRTPLGRIEGRIGRFEHFLASIDGAAVPTLWFHHALLPHGPIEYLPDGELYDGRDVFGVHGRFVTRPDGTVRTSLRWPADSWLVRQFHQRVLFQQMYADRLLGRLVARAKAQGLYERALFVVTSDHGLCTEPGKDLRDAVRPRRGDLPGTHAEILSIPLIVKLPHGERGGEVSDRNVESIDVVPTIAQVLGITIPWRVDGCSMLAGRPRPHKRYCDQGFRSVTLSARIEGLEAAVRRKRSWFASRGDGPWFYKLEPFGGLCGAAVDTATLEEDPAITVHLRRPAQGAGASRMSSHLRGTVESPRLRKGPLFLALLRKGRILALTRTAHAGKDTSPFLAFFPPTALAPEGGDVEVAVLAPRGKGRFCLVRPRVQSGPA